MVLIGTVIAMVMRVSFMAFSAIGSVIEAKYKFAPCSKAFTNTETSGTMSIIIKNSIAIVVKPPEQFLSLLPPAFLHIPLYLPFFILTGTIPAIQITPSLPYVCQLPPNTPATLYIPYSL